MPLLAGRPVSSLTEQDLSSLIGTASEGRYIDFKVAVIGTNDEAKREFLADVSSFANTSGGHLVIGMDEDDGVASAIPGVELPNVDAEKLRLEGIIRGGLDPRLPAVVVEAVPLAGGRYAVVVDVAHSWVGPHMITFKNHSRFYARGSAGKVQMDISEIRRAILGGEARTERIRALHIERIGTYQRNLIPGLNRAQASGILMHLVPMNALDMGVGVELTEAVRRDPDVRPLYSDLEYPPGRFNLDGILVDDTGFGGGGRGAQQYIQLHRRGIVETCDNYLLDRQGTEKILGYPVERTLIDDTHRFLGLMERIGVEPPVIALITIISTEGRVVVPSDDFWDGSRAHQVDRGMLPLPEIVLDRFDVDTSTALRPALDAMWQAGGYGASPNYSADGVWQRRES